MNRATGIFGGTFDPVHFGHLRAASEVSEMLQIDDFRLMPAGTPPHRNTTFASGTHRLEMLRLAVAEHPDIQVDEREVLRTGNSYMVDTLTELRASSAEQPLLLFVGQDAANTLDSWHRWAEIFSLAHAVIMTRPNARHDYSAELGEQIMKRTVVDIDRLFAQPGGLVCSLNVTQLAISSTDIRDRIGRGLSARFLAPDPVLNYIARHGLYCR